MVPSAFPVDTEDGKIVLARKPHIAYYLDMKLEMFPYVNS